MPVSDCMVVENSEQKDSTSVNLVGLRSRASTVRDELKRQSSREDKVQKEFFQFYYYVWN